MLRAETDRIIEQALTGLGYELVDVEFFPRSKLLRVYIDKPEGVTVDDCAFVSNQLVRVFTVEGVDFERLEISSPGLDRPLKRRADFERFLGKPAQVRSRLPVGGNRRNFTGTIASVDDEGLRLEADGGSWVIGWENIERARLVPQL